MIEYAVVWLIGARAQCGPGFISVAKLMKFFVVPAIVRTKNSARRCKPWNGRCGAVFWGPAWLLAAQNYEFSLAGKCFLEKFSEEVEKSPAGNGFGGTDTVLEDGTRGSFSSTTEWESNPKNTPRLHFSHQRPWSFPVKNSKYQKFVVSL